MRADTAELPDTPEFGVQEESKGLAYVWPYDGGLPREDDANEDEDEEEAAIVQGARQGRKPSARKEPGDTRISVSRSDYRHHGR